MKPNPTLSIPVILSVATRYLVASGGTGHLLPSTVNHVSTSITLPHQDSATLPLSVMNWLHSQGLTYVIPHVPRGFPPVSAVAAARAAANHTPVGSYPMIRDVALISPVTVIPPLRQHRIYWAVVIGARGGRRDVVFVTFVAVSRPTVIGSLHHAHSVASTR